MWLLSLLLTTIAPLGGYGGTPLRALFFDLFKLCGLATMILGILPDQLPFFCNIIIATGLAVLVSLLAGHLLVLSHRRMGVPLCLKALQKEFKADATSLSVNYCAFLLGSGGHTKEMSSMIKKNFRPVPNMHRRYIITSGDNYSASVLTQLEQRLDKAVGVDSSGTYDVYLAKRSRRVHETWYSTIWSVLNSTRSLLAALTTAPQVRGGSSFGPPNVVVTNGPGTGFILCLIAHMMKVVGVTPRHRPQIVYVESLARVKTLSLTGKLFAWTGIADLFIVQHPDLAKGYGVVYGGFMVET